MLEVALVAFKQNQHINVAVAAGITTSFRALEYGSCRGGNLANCLANLVYNFRSSHIQSSFYDAKVVKNLRIATYLYKKVLIFM